MANDKNNQVQPGDLLYAMKNKYREVIKEIIGPGAEERGFTYSCTGGMAMTKPLAMYSRKDENMTQMIYIYQDKIYPTNFGFDLNDIMHTRKYICETIEDFIVAVKEVNNYLLSVRYSELDEDLNSPFRVRKKDEEEFRDRFDELATLFENDYPMNQEWTTLEKFRYLDECYKDVCKYEGDELREFLMKMAAEYGKALLSLPHMKLEWNEENSRLMVVSSDLSVIGRNRMLLLYLFRTR